jgi:hypothetical protein
MPANPHPLLDSLPLDVFCTMVSSLDLDSAVSLSRVNRQLNSLFREESICRAVVKVSQVRADPDVISTDNPKDPCEIFKGG